MKSYIKKYFSEFAYNIFVLLLLSIIMTFFSPIFPSHTIDGFLDMWILLASYLLVGFIIKFIIGAVYGGIKRIMPLPFILNKWITRLSNIIFYLLLAAAYYAQIFVIIYYRIIGDTAKHMFSFIQQDGLTTFLQVMDTSYTTFIFIIIALVAIYIVIFGSMVFHSKVTKHIKKTYKHVFISVLGIGFIILMITGIMHYRYIFTTDKDNTVINTQLSFFDVTNSPLLAKYSQHLANQLTPLEQQFIKKYFIQMSKEEKSFASKKQKFVLQNKHPIEIPIVPKKKMKNIIFFVIDTTRYDVFQMVVKKDPWLHDFVKNNIVFTNHYSAASLSLDSVMAIITGYFPQSPFPLISQHINLYGYYGDYNSNMDLRTERQYYPLLIRTITKNYPNDRLLLAGLECASYIFYPLNWCVNTKARFVYNKKDIFIVLWNSVTAFMNMLQEDSVKPFVVYFQPQTVHGNGMHRLAFPYAHLPTGRVFSHSKALKGSADSVEVSVLAFKYMVQELKARGLYDNTIIILTSDHGELYGEYGLWAHGNGFDETLLHVPLVIHWPGKKPHVYTHKTSHYDLVPTLMKEYFGYKGDAKTISIGNNLFDITKSWKYLTISVWGGFPGLYMSNNICFTIKATKISTNFIGCIPTHKASGVNAKTLNLLYGYLTQHVNGFGPLPKYKGDQ